MVGLLSRSLYGAAAPAWGLKWAYALLPFLVTWATFVCSLPDSISASVCVISCYSLIIFSSLIFNYFFNKVVLVLQTSSLTTWIYLQILNTDDLLAKIIVGWKLFCVNASTLQSKRLNKFFYYFNVSNYVQF